MFLREKNKKTNDFFINIIKDDIINRKVDVIVNAAHEGLTGGGGVDGSIHMAAGQKLLGECMGLYGCPTGEVRITNGYNLLSKYIIHTVGPVWSHDQSRQPQLIDLLSCCYKNCLTLAEIQGLKSISFPCISTGAYCFPKELAARIAIDSIYQWKNQHIGEESKKKGCYLDVIEIVCFLDEDFNIYQKIISNYNF